VIRRTVERTARKSDGDEIVQGIISDLIVGSLTSEPEIGNYAGRAPLGRWLHVVARRAALRWVRAESKTAGIAQLASAEPTLGGSTPPEIALFRQRFGPTFQRALKDVLSEAPEADRAILRLYLVNNVSVEKIGKILGVSQPTASRWLAKAREDVLSNLKRILKGVSRAPGPIDRARRARQIAAPATATDWRIHTAFSNAERPKQDPAWPPNTNIAVTLGRCSIPMITTK